MTDNRERWPHIAMAALVAQIPFELRLPLLGFSNLQWTFLAAAMVCAPLVLRNWKNLLADRLVQAAALFVATQWFAAGIAPEFHTNAYKAAVRFSAGFVLLVISRTLNNEKSICRVWGVASGIAAIYALSAYAGFGVPRLFRNEEFYLDQIQRLSGSFEYPNTAAAYFAMSLPIVWWSSFRPVWKWGIALLLWAAITLTFSKGALLAVPIVALAGTVLSRSKCRTRQTSAALVGTGILAYAALLPVTQYLSERADGVGKQNPFAATYVTPWNKLEQQPNANDIVPVQIRNTGITKWRSQGLWRVAVSYRWWSAQTQTFLNGDRPVITMLPRDVGRGEAADILTAIQTPQSPGQYILVVELFSRDLDWFSQTGVVPALLQVDVRPMVARATGQADLTAYYNREKTKRAEEGKRGDSLTAAVPRSSLWGAGIKMFVEHPFGVGPDNYRLEYGKYLGASEWNTQIYSNNLYLELLTGSGFPGLGAFVLMILTMKWRTQAEFLAVAVFLVHGLVDVFLMTTPIYFAFWTLVGMRKDDVSQMFPV